MNEGDNQVEVVSDDHAMAELLKVENRYNEDQVFDECPQRVESEVLVELHSIQNANTTETEIVNLHLDSRLQVLVVEDTIPKLMGLTYGFITYNVTAHLESAPLSVSIEVLSFLFKRMGHKLDMELGDKLFDTMLERDIFAAFCGPHTTIGSLPHALGLYICFWVDTGQVFWACVDRVESGVHSFSRVLLFSYFNGFPFLNVVDAEAKLPTLVAVKSEDWEENASALIEIEGAKISEPPDKSSEGVCLTERCNEWTDSIIVEAQLKTTKIVSIEATLEQSENKKQEQSVDVEALPKFLAPLQIQKMVERRDPCMKSGLVDASYITRLFLRSVYIADIVFLAYASKMKDGTTDIVFDPGGMVFDWLHQVKELHNRVENCCWCLAFLNPIVPSFVHFLDYGRTYDPSGFEIVIKWNKRQLIGVLDVYRRNIKFDGSELQYNFLVCSLLEWDIIVVGLATFPVDTVHRGLVMTSAEAVKNKGLKDIMEHNLPFISPTSFFRFMGARRNWKFQISSPFSAYCQSLIYCGMDANSKKDGKTTLVFDPGGLDFTIRCLNIEVFSCSSSRQRSFHAENTRCLDTSFWKNGGWIKRGGTLHVGFLHIQGQLSILESWFLENNSHKLILLIFLVHIITFHIMKWRGC